MTFVTALPLLATLAGQAAPAAETPVLSRAPELTLEPPRVSAPAPPSSSSARCWALDAGWYEWQIELNKQDFDFARSFSGQWRRLGSPAGYRFDDNDRYLNVGHAFMGATYYQIARANGASLLQATLFNIGASTAWEGGRRAPRGRERQRSDRHGPRRRAHSARPSSAPATCSRTARPPFATACSWASSRPCSWPPGWGARRRSRPAATTATASTRPLRTGSTWRSARRRASRGRPRATPTRLGSRTAASTSR
jgi:hypothetical protein